eukprot:11187690-Lingulodinium_polyedra.AAC.1
MLPNVGMPRARHGCKANAMQGGGRRTRTNATCHACPACPDQAKRCARTRLVHKQQEERKESVYDH